MNFDPSAPASQDSGIFGLPFTLENSKVVLIPVPWEVTTSYRQGTALGPEKIVSASHQVDLYDVAIERPYLPGIYCLEESKTVRAMNDEGRQSKEDTSQVNELGARLNRYVFDETSRLLDSGKIVGIIGGDHSVPFGAMQAMAKKTDFGVLHFDAHSDTREAFEGFQWSHASIFHNVLTRIPEVKKLVQVGIRDFCEEEEAFCNSQKDRVKVFYDKVLSERRFSGESYRAICESVIENLPQKVWISFDIDGLSGDYCPNTGTPVPGGLSFNEAAYLIEQCVRSGRMILGFDLCEVAPGKDSEWDAIVGARLLYKLIAFTLASQKLCRLR